LTIQQFYRPSGDSTQDRGVMADVELPSLTTHLDVGEADLEYPLAFDRVNPVPHTKYELMDTALIEQLRAHSVQRQVDSEDFRKELQKIQRYRERKDRKTMTLNEEKFLAEQAEFNEEKEEEEEIESLQDNDDEVVQRDYYFNEVLAITADYLEQLEKYKVVRNR
jgi:carboxyl-terminal processing protease